jgi:SAM-dependent methyltransferase
MNAPPENYKEKHSPSAEAQKLFAEGWHRQALEQYIQWLQDEPENPEAHFGRALCLLHLGQTRQAKSSYQKFMALASTNLETQEKYKQQWQTHIKATRGVRLTKFLKNFYHSFPALGSLLQRCRFLTYWGSVQMLKIYEPLVCFKILPKILLETKPKSSVAGFLSMLLRHHDHYQLPPVSYARMAEAALFLRALDKWKPQSLVDVGTGNNPLAVFWASQGVKVTCTDPDFFVHSLIPLSEKMGISSSNSLQITVADGRRLPLSDNSFDLWTSVSVVEHIPEEGDTEALQEAARVLKPGGIAILTTEAEPQPRERWYRAEGHFGKEYRQKKEDKKNSSNTNIPELRQETLALLRPYNYESLLDRLVHPTGMELLEAGFIDKRFDTDFRGALDSPEKPWWGVILFHILPLVAFWSYRRVENPEENTIHPGATAYVVLKKPAR